jgi:Ca-activated chloride channel family protein
MRKVGNMLEVKYLQVALSIGIITLQPLVLSAADTGLRQYKKGNFQEAIRTYDRILKDHGDWEEAHFGKGAALYKAQRLDEALQEFEKSIAIKDPTRKAAVYYNLGNALYQSGRVEESLSFFKKALELNPRDYDAKYNYELARQMMQNQQKQDQNNRKNKIRNKTNNRISPRKTSPRIKKNNSNSSRRKAAVRRKKVKKKPRRCSTP